MLVNICGLDGADHKLSLADKAKSVEDLKKQIEKVLKFPKNDLRIFALRGELEEGGKLKDYDVKEGGTLFLVQKSKKCFKCGEPLNSMKTGLTRAEGAAHFRCVGCTECGAKLDEARIYLMNGKPVCHDDFQKSIKECALCNQKVVDEIISAIGKHFHPWCFKCRSCEASLKDKPFMADDSKEKVFCPDCFHNKFGKKCATCGEPIKEQIVTALEQTYHPKCFVCSVCKEKLTGKFMADNNQRPLCSKCFEESVAERCATCGKAIVAEKGSDTVKKVIANGKSYHVKCKIK